MSLAKILLFCILVFGFSACAGLDKTEQVGRLSIMTYNVENLFDTIDDPGKSDETYLPISLKRSKAHQKKCQGYRFEKWKNQCLNWDWSEEVLQEKLERLGEAIMQDGGGRGPDLIVFQEIENENVLRRLRDEKLEKLGYKELVLVEGRDRRGIDIAILSRLPVVGTPKLHDIPFAGFPKDRVEDTRGILQADFELPGERVLSVFGTHFPAPFHPVEMRVQAFQALSKIRRQLPKDRLVIAAGDFNVPSDEDRKGKILDKYAKADWLIAHRIGCADCRGTNYYPPKKSWSFLDMILLSHDFEDGSLGWRVLPETVRLVNGTDAQKTPEGYPNPFQLPEVTGVSDHWPLAVDIVSTKK